MKLITGFLATWALLLTANLGLADTMTVNLQDAGATNTIKNTNPVAPYNGPARAGLMSLAYVGGSAGIGSSSAFFVKDNPPTNQIAAFCIDLKETISFGNDTVYNIVALTDAPNYSGNSGSHMLPAQADRIRALWANFINNTGSNLTVDDGVNSSDRNAAFQLAVWEIVYDAGPFNVTDATSTFSASGLSVGVLGELIAMTTFLGTVTPGDSKPRANLFALSAPSGSVSTVNQDLIVEYVPEPGTILSLATMTLAGVFGLGLRNARRRKVLQDSVG